MANWYGTARTNFVRFKDEEAFKAARGLVTDFGNGWHTLHGEPLVAMISGSNYDDGAFCTFSLDEDDNDVELDWEDVAKHLADGQVLVGMEAGAEKLRYVTGIAWAMDNKGGKSVVRLDDIYEKAERELGVSPTPAEYETFPRSDV